MGIIGEWKVPRARDHLARSKTDRELIVKNPDERQAVPIRGWLTVKEVITSLLLLPGFQNHAVTGTACKVILFSKLDDLALEGGHVHMLSGHVNGTTDLADFNRLIQNTFAGIQFKQTQFAESALVIFRIGAFHGAERRDDPDLSGGNGR